MLHLIYDTETNGLPLTYSAHVHEVDNWPRLVQLGWVIIDSEFNVITSRNHIIKPDGWDIPVSTSKIHGISTLRALEEGVDIRIPLVEFHIAQEMCQVAAGHNINFDRKVLGAEFIRADMEHGYQYGKLSLPKICTMFKTVKLCGLPQPTGRGMKWPTLTELHNHLFDEDFENAHDAMADVMATRRCYAELVNMGHIEPDRIANEYHAKIWSAEQAAKNDS
jgi:DNA polymerase III epsilon subunit-like protein